MRGNNYMNDTFIQGEGIQKDEDKQNSLVQNEIEKTPEMDTVETQPDDVFQTQPSPESPKAGLIAKDTKYPGLQELLDWAEELKEENGQETIQTPTITSDLTLVDAKIGKFRWWIIVAYLLILSFSVSVVAISIIPSRKQEALPTTQTSQKTEYVTPIVVLTEQVSNKPTTTAEAESQEETSIQLDLLYSPLVMLSTPTQPIQVLATVTKDSQPVNNITVNFEPFSNKENEEWNKKSGSTDENGQIKKDWVTPKDEDEGSVRIRVTAGNISKIAFIEWKSAPIPTPAPTPMLIQGDNDEDGFSNVLENIIGTNPDNIDTDGDDFSDSEEMLILSTNPLVNNLYMPNVSDGNLIFRQAPNYENYGLFEDAVRFFNLEVYEENYTFISIKLKASECEEDGTGGYMVEGRLLDPLTDTLWLNLDKKVPAFIVEREPFCVVQIYGYVTSSAIKPVEQ